MMVVNYDKEKLFKELRFTTSRSSGPGGQNINKLETKVTLKWNINKSHVFTDEQKELLLEKLAGRINKVGELVLSVQATRSQLQNREQVLIIIDELLSKALYVPKPRKKTKVPRAQVEKRLLEKRKQSEKKKLRGKNESDYS